MENQLTEFIALTSYTSERLGWESAIPLSVIEKILSISKNILKIPIEYLETKIYRYGSVNRWTPNLLVVEKTPLELKSIRSKYFVKKSLQPSEISFVYTEKFKTQMDTIRNKTYLIQYETAISELLYIWKKEGGLQNLIFIDLFRNNDGGMCFLVADLEIIANDILEYTREVFYLEPPRRSTQKEERKEKTNEKIQKTYNSLCEKLHILRNSEKNISLLSKGTKSILRKHLLSSARTFPSDSFLFDIIEAIACLLINTWKIIKKSSPECTAQPKLFRENEIPKTEVVKQLENLLSKLLEIKSCSFPAENYDEDKLIDIVIKITNEIGLWNRALLGKYDLKFLRAHYLKGEESYKPHNHITFYDIKKSTYILNLLDKNISSPVFNDYQRWFKQITSTPKNWSILFGGKISPKEENAGDKLSAYFSSFWSCIYSVAFSMCHLSMLDTISNDPFRFRVRSGIGEGNVYFSAEQEHCLTINHLAHAIEKIADLDTKYEPNEPYCLAIENYLKDHQQLERFLNKKDLKVEFKEGVAVPIRLNKLVEKFINEFKELK